MRRVLSAREYESLLRCLTMDQRQEAADVIDRAARELMARHGLERAVILCGSLLREIGELAAKRLGATITLYPGDELPELSHGLICDMLLSSLQ